MPGYLLFVCTVFPILLKLAEVFSRDGMSFLASCQNLVPRPWVIDDLDTFKAKWTKKSWKKASPCECVMYLARLLFFLQYSLFQYNWKKFMLLYMFLISHLISFVCIGRQSFLLITLVQMWSWVLCHLQESWSDVGPRFGVKIPKTFHLYFNEICIIYGCVHVCVSACVWYKFLHFRDCT